MSKWVNILKDENPALKKASRSSGRSKRKRSAASRRFVADGADGLRLAFDSRLEQLEATNFDDFADKEDGDDDDYFDDEADGGGKGSPNKRAKRGAAKAAKLKMRKVSRSSFFCFFPYSFLLFSFPHNGSFSVCLSFFLFFFLPNISFPPFFLVFIVSVTDHNMSPLGEQREKGQENGRCALDDQI